MSTYEDSCHQREECQVEKLATEEKPPKKTTTPCPTKPKEPVCLNCRQPHSTAYRGCPSTMERVKAAQIRLGITSRPKATPVTTLSHTCNPWTQKMTHVADIIASDYSLRTDFPGLPLMKPVKPVTTPVNPANTPPTNQQKNNVTSAVVAIMAHMSSIWALMTKDKVMI
ncbi:hypothetical protein LSH36_167g02004 [Paralvinella palmiformis]|uniref:Uncharacterized protein n=1 Tax=Paralvinella palmiformis TaxID=53620 RepID=A0AAD9JTB4_9ANNE|nr:hypothetical protein LSH36_167g02004 [Paralvinella palmiformis]